MTALVTLLSITALTAATAAAAQQPMGTLPLADAKLTGSLEIDGTRATLMSNVALTAYGRTASVTLARGGAVQVCATSALHLLHSGSSDALLFALDHGAAEIRSLARPQDVILTPDIRFSMLSTGTLDLRLRVSPEGDTCVDNHGGTAPTLALTEAFGSATYRLAPGQHVLFEHASLRAVVDNERSDCGCPASTPIMVASTARNATADVAKPQVAAEHPFPAAESAGLVATPPPLDAAAAHPPVDAALSLSTGAPASPPAPQLPPAVAPAPAAAAATAPPPSPPGAHAIKHSIGNFFRRIFRRPAKA